MSCPAQRQSASKALTALVAGLSVWALVLIALTTVPLDWGDYSGVYSPTGLLTASAEPHEAGVTFQRQLLRVD